MNSWRSRVGASIACAFALVATPAIAHEVGPPGEVSVLAYPQEVSFGRVGKNGTRTKSVRFANVGAVPATLGPVGIFSHGTPAFGMAGDDCGAEIVELAPGSSCTYVIRFAPSSAVGRTGRHYVSELRFRTAAGDAAVALKGAAASR